ncbi:MAG TPA: hypothetical protein VFR09_08215 [Alphaproteobacteria bacterium]|nr:hypothetical protein [Alphaproteobacteria bacterium]
MSTMLAKNPANEPRIGDVAATQPLSGTSSVEETFAVNGHGRGAYVRTEKTDKKPAA